MPTELGQPQPPEQEYERCDFEAILSSYNQTLDNSQVRDDGVWLKERNGGYEAVDWAPSWDMEGTNSPNPLNTPALPFPFTSRWLAAWMLDGPGYFLRERFGEWSDGPDEDSLGALGGGAVKARKALIEAYAAYRDAAALVGRDAVDINVPAAQAHYQAAETRTQARFDWREQGFSEQERDSRRQEYRIAMKPANDELAQARREAMAAHRRWRKEMVRVLLEPVALAPALFAADGSVALVSPRIGGEKWTDEHRTELMRQHAALRQQGHKVYQADELIAQAWGTSPSSIKDQRLKSAKRA